MAAGAGGRASAGGGAGFLRRLRPRCAPLPDARARGADDRRGDACRRAVRHARAHARGDARARRHAGRRARAAAGGPLRGGGGRLRVRGRDGERRGPAVGGAAGRVGGGARGGRRRTRAGAGAAGAGGGSGGIERGDARRLPARPAPERGGPGSRRRRTSFAPTPCSAAATRWRSTPPPNTRARWPESGDAAGAARAWDALLALPDLGEALRLAILRQRAELARETGDLEGRARWLGQLAALTGEAAALHELASAAFLLGDLALFGEQLRAVMERWPGSEEALQAIADLRDAGFDVDAGAEGYVYYRHRAYAEARAALAAGLAEPGLPGRRARLPRLLPGRRLRRRRLPRGVRAALRRGGREPRCGRLRPSRALLGGARDGDAGRARGGGAPSRGGGGRRRPVLGGERLPRRVRAAARGRRGGGHRGLGDAVGARRPRALLDGPRPRGAGRHGRGARGLAAGGGGVPALLPRHRGAPRAGRARGPRTGARGPCPPLPPTGTRWTPGWRRSPPAGPSPPSPRRRRSWRWRACPRWRTRRWRWRRAPRRRASCWRWRARPRRRACRGAPPSSPRPCGRGWGWPRASCRTRSRGCSTRSPTRPCWRRTRARAASTRCCWPRSSSRRAAGTRTPSPSPGPWA